MMTTVTRTISVNRDVRAELRRQAEDMRQDFTRKGIFVVNMVSSPGAGKTSLLAAMAQHWSGLSRMAVLVGDLATDRDARRLAPYCPVEQLTTGGACHLEIPLIKQGLEKLGNSGYEFLFIENVGNLVCPASHDLAEHMRVVVLSVTEGDDKPGKYPKMFRSSKAMIVSKMDLLPYVPFSLAAAIADAHEIQPELRPFPICSVSGEGLETWCRYLLDCRNEMLSRPSLTDRFPHECI